MQQNEVNIMSKYGHTTTPIPLFVLLLTFVFLAVGTSPIASADWNQNIIEIDATYEVVSQDMIVHISKEFTFSNHDIDTRFWKGYYSNLNYKLPGGIENIQVYDSDQKMEYYKPDAQGDYYTFEFNKNIWYDKSYTFTVEYDLVTNKNTAAFYIIENGDNTKVTVSIPNEYEVSIDRNDYIKIQHPDVTKYIFNKGLNWDGSCFVNAVHVTEMQVIRDTVQLKEKDVVISIEFWDGEDEWANTMMHTAIESLPVLEEVSDLPYPMKYNITITQATSADTLGYGGVNNGKDGIILLYTENYETLIHELAHYWTMECDFEAIWMDEGYANLYTYLVLEHNHPDDAVARKELYFEQYENMKPVYDIQLSDWTVPDAFNSENANKIDYGYKKSFVIAYNKYEKEGLGSVQVSDLKLL
ncbi:MAG: hypothetical protein P1P69_05690 [Methanosarcinaceae archaeon]|nr:hypothetical protein [Methanosarcinaceae archaeon]